MVMMVTIGLTADSLADNCGHEECVKAIDDYFAELSANSSSHEPNESQAAAAAAAAASKPGNFCIFTYTLAGISWWRSIVVRLPVLADELSLSCARLTLWVKRPLSVNQHGQLSQPSLRGRLNE